MISLSNIGIHQGAFRLENVSLEIAAGEYGVLMSKRGPARQHC